MRLLAARTPTVTDWCLSQICDRWHNCCWTQWDWSRQSVAFFALCPALLEGHQLDDDFQKINLYFVGRGNAPQKQAACNSDHVMFYLIQQCPKDLLKNPKIQRKTVLAKETNFCRRKHTNKGDKLLQNETYQQRRLTSNEGTETSFSGLWVGGWSGSLPILVWINQVQRSARHNCASFSLDWNRNKFSLIFLIQVKEVPESSRKKSVP